jgi:hypothetical protein
VSHVAEIGPSAFRESAGPEVLFTRRQRPACPSPSNHTRAFKAPGLAQNDAAGRREAAEVAILEAAAHDPKRPDVAVWCVPMMRLIRGLVLGSSAPEFSCERRFERLSEIS